MRTLPQQCGRHRGDEDIGGSGEHSDEIEAKGDDQFEIADGRSVEEVVAALTARGLQPVMNDYIYV